jgi:hypothetical protein
MRFAPLLALLAAVPACATFDGPPEVTIQGAMEGLLADPTAPIVLAFSKPPTPSTLKLEIAPYRVDAEGNLRDEDKDPDTLLDPIFTHDPMDGDTGGGAVLAADGSTMTINPTVALPVGAQLVLLIEPGLADAAGAKTVERRRIVFGFSSKLDCNAPTAVFKSGTYFFLAEVNQPIHAQIQLFSAVVLDAATGSFKSQFSKAKRNPDATCPTPCAASEVCRMIPAPACVAPSEPAGSVDEFPDYIPNPAAPTGFTFAADGCAVDQGPTTVAFATAPVDVQVAMPMVTLRNAKLSSSFTLGSDGLLRGTGSLTADAVLLGTIDSGKGAGDLTAVSIPAGKEPPGVPAPEP